MASGNRRLRINTQERAISTDINRLQTFQHQDFAELFRGMLDTYVVSEDNDLTEVAPSTIETPLRAEIISGLMVKPQAGVLDLLVDPGVLYALAPDGAADESGYKYVRDDGIVNTGVLQMTANASGSTRIDVVECSINPVELIVTDSRDIFNAATGLFSASTVTKELRGRLQYRVRAGTPGSGMPANQAGWLPLVVASVPTGTTTNNTITFWDVRPMVKDREFGVAGTGAPDMVKVPETSGFLTFAAGPISTLAGHTLTSLNGRKLGGRIRRGTPGTDADNIILTDSANFDPGFATTNLGLAFLYLVTPFGLPRWARYTDGPTGRVPRSPRGIPVLTLVGPSNFTGKPSSAITLPTSMGFAGATTTAGVCVATAVMKTGGGFYNAGFNGRNTALEQAPAFLTGVAAGGGSMKWTVTPNVQFPANAKGVYATIQFSRTLAAGVTEEYDLFASVYNGAFGSGNPNTTNPLTRIVIGNPTAGSLTVSHRPAPIWLPLPQYYPGAAPGTFDVGMFFNGVTTFAAGPFLSFVGFTY